MTTHLSPSQPERPRGVGPSASPANGSQTAVANGSQTEGPRARADAPVSAPANGLQTEGPRARARTRAGTPCGESRGGPGGGEPRTGILTFTRLKWVSFTHSCIYLALLLCAFALAKPEPLTFVLGMTHGLLWIAMSLVCILCARLRVLPLRVAVSVAVLGGIGPFFGSYEFVRAGRTRAPATAS